jgi:hypothetical protein
MLLARNPAGPTSAIYGTMIVKEPPPKKEWAVSITQKTGKIAGDDLCSFLPDRIGRRAWGFPMCLRGVAALACSASKREAARLRKSMPRSPSPRPRFAACQQPSWADLAGSLRHGKSDQELVEVGSRHCSLFDADLPSVIAPPVIPRATGVCVWESGGLQLN